MKTYQPVIFAAAFMLACGCSKQDAFLAAKPNIALSTPSTLQDLQLLLNDDGIFNTKDPGLGEVSSDDFYVPDAGFTNLAQTERNAYTWAGKIYNPGADVPDWSGPYQQVYYANTVLDALKTIPVTPAQTTLAGQVRAGALFDRCWAFYNLLQVFAMPYDSATAATEPGIPLRLSSDLNAKSVRASEQACYAQVISDLHAAIPLLPGNAAYNTLPSAAAAAGLLARVYLALGDYARAYHYADTCISLAPPLVGYGSLQPATRSISTSFVQEDIYHTICVPYLLTYGNYKSVTDSTLYGSYAANDLRKSVFFVLSGGLPYFRGSYDPKGRNYTGIATDEMYLIRAECNARLGHAASAMADLNTLLATRWQSGTFAPYTASGAGDALGLVLAERRKELLYRGLRWADLRRLNKDSRFATTLHRVANGTAYSLPPNDLRYALPIPDNEIQFSGIAQNPR